MVQIAAASHFWAAVQDCLVTFHQFEPREAAEKVTSLWRRLPSAANGSDFSEMIYHAEPWQIACNLAGNDLPVAEHQEAYQAVLQRSELAVG